MSINANVLKTKDWKVNVGASITFEKNKVVKLPEQNKGGIISGTKKIVEGKDRYQFYTYTWEGVNTKNGFSLYKFNDEEYFFSDDTNTYGDPAGKEIKGSTPSVLTPSSVLLSFTPIAGVIIRVIPKVSFCVPTRVLAIRHSLLRQRLMLRFIRISTRLSAFIRRVVALAKSSTSQDLMSLMPSMPRLP